MTNKEAIECIEAIHVQMFNSGNSKWTEACDMAIEALKEQRPHGEWKEVCDFDGNHYKWECSVCGRLEEFEEDFCNCGADMRVKDELNRVSKELNSEIEKSKSEIVPDYRDGWRMRGEEE